jgi:hypothetical protein
MRFHRALLPQPIQQPADYRALSMFGPPMEWTRQDLYRTGYRRFSTPYRQGCLGSPDADETSRRAVLTPPTHCQRGPTFTVRRNLRLSVRFRQTVPVEKLRQVSYAACRDASVSGIGSRRGGYAKRAPLCRQYALRSRSTLTRVTARIRRSSIGDQCRR